MPAPSVTNDGVTFTTVAYLQILDFSAADVGDYYCQVVFTSPVLSEDSSEISLAIQGKFNFSIGLYLSNNRGL